MEDFDKNYYEETDDLLEPKALDTNPDIDIEESSFWNKNIDNIVWFSKHSVFEDLNSYDDYKIPHNEKDYATRCYYDEISEEKIRPLSRWETRKLLLQYRRLWDNDPEWLEARDKVVKSYLRYVYSIAKPIYEWFKSEYSWVKVELNDVIQVWNIWLIESLQKYKPRDVKSFLYHAKYAIKNSIYRYLKYDIRFFGSWDDRHPIWAPKHIRKFINDYYNENLVEPTDYEIQDFIKKYNINASAPSSVDFGYYYKYYLKLGNISLDQPAEQWQQLWIENETTLSNRVFMIDDTNQYSDNKYDGYEYDDQCDNRDVTLKDTLLDQSGNDADRWAFLDSLKLELKEAFTVLTENEKIVLKLYFWLDGTKPLSLEEIAQNMGYSRERIRQIKEKALRVLKGFSKNIVKKYYYTMKKDRVRFYPKSYILKEYLQD